MNINYFNFPQCIFYFPFWLILSAYPEKITGDCTYVFLMVSLVISSVTKLKFVGFTRSSYLTPLVLVKIEELILYFCHNVGIFYCCRCSFLQSALPSASAKSINSWLISMLYCRSFSMICLIYLAESSLALSNYLFNTL